MWPIAWQKPFKWTKIILAYDFGGSAHGCLAPVAVGVCVAEESYLSLGRPVAERRKGLGTQCNFQSHTTVAFFLHLCPPPKFPQPPEAVPQLRSRATAGLWQILHTETVPNCTTPLWAVSNTGGWTAKMSDLYSNACSYWNVTLIFINDYSSISTY